MRTWSLYNVHRLSYQLTDLLCLTKNRSICSTTHPLLALCRTFPQKILKIYMKHKEGNIIPYLHITVSFSILNRIQTACFTKLIWMARAKYVLKKQTKEFWGVKKYCLLRASMSFAVFDIVLLYWNGDVCRINFESAGSYIVLCAWR